MSRDKNLREKLSKELSNVTDRIDEMKHHSQAQIDAAKRKLRGN